MLATASLNEVMLILFYLQSLAFLHYCIDLMNSELIICFWIHPTFACLFACLQVGGRLIEKEEENIF